MSKQTANKKTVKKINYPKNRKKRVGKSGPDKGEGGAPKKVFDFELLEKLCKTKCGQKRIELIIGLDIDTISARLQEKHGLTFSEYYEKKSAECEEYFRQTLFDKATNDNPQYNAIAIFLAKNVLGMSDKVEMGGMGENLDKTLMTREEQEKRLTELAKKQLESIQNQEADNE